MVRKSFSKTQRVPGPSAKPHYMKWWIINKIKTNLRWTLKHPHRPILNKRAGSDLDCISLYLRVNSMSPTSPHKDFFVFSIHTSGHKVGPLKRCQTLALVRLFSAPWNEGMEPSQPLLRKSAQSDRVRGPWRQMCVHSKRQKICIVLTKGCSAQAGLFTAQIMGMCVWCFRAKICQETWSWSGSSIFKLLQ